MIHQQMKQFDGHDNMGISFKIAGDEAFTSGRFEDAYAAYEDALAHNACDAKILCNKSAAALRLGRANDALVDADLALRTLATGTGTGTADGGLHAKACHRKAQALVALGRLVDAVRTYREGLAACGGATELHAALRVLMDQLPARWLARYWARHVEAAQAPHPLSSRDGRLLRPVPAERRLAPAALEARLSEAMGARQQREARDLACAAWAQGRAPGRAEAAYFRGLAYLQARDTQQAEKDARVALVYGPRMPADPAAAAAAVAAAADVGQPAPPADRSCWPAALALHSASLEALGENTPAALAAAYAAELDPECAEHAAAVERLARRVPEAQGEALASGGPAALEAALAADRERSRPEFLRRRPKYYYYYEWMRRRLGERHPTLPAPVVDKLLTMDANELDLLLQYPAATDATVARVLGVYEREGEAAVAAYQVPLLSWQEVQELQGGGVPSTLEGAAAPKLLEDGGGGGGASEDDAQHAGQAPHPDEADKVATGPGGGLERSGSGVVRQAEEEGSDAGSVSVDLHDDLFELD